MVLFPLEELEMNRVSYFGKESALLVVVGLLLQEAQGTTIPLFGERCRFCRKSTAFKRISILRRGSRRLNELCVERDIH